MTDYSFLAHLPDVFAIHEPRFFLCDDEGVVRQVSIHELSAYEGKIVTYDASVLVEELIRKEVSPPSYLINAGDALRLCVGRPRNEGGEKRWDIWRALRPHFPKSKEFSEFRAMYQARMHRPDDDYVNQVMKSAAAALRRLWFSIKKQLEARGEYKRFFEIEEPIQPIFLYRQYTGIRVEPTILKESIEEAKQEKYVAYREVARLTNESPSGLTFRNVHKVLGKTDARHLLPFGSGPSLESYFKIAASNSSFAAEFLKYIRSGRDVSILTQLADRSGRVHPSFQPIGTITARILVARPYLQQLRRHLRRVIAADMGKELLYFDYSQYEPGILAFLSDDANLTADYNSRDLYLSLSESVFDDDSHRDQAKQIFLSFCYGMKQSNIAKLLVGTNADKSQLSEIEKRVSAFFGRYSGLVSYRDRLESNLKKDGYASSILGNRRYRGRKGSLSQKEQRWVVSQAIQGTASLIFKEAIIGLEKEFGSNSILLPMHDAVLMQFEAGGIGEREEIACRIMADVFKRYCSTIEPRVTAGQFGP